MRINIRNKGLKRFVQRALLPGIHVVFFVCLFLGTTTYTHAAESEQSFAESAWSVVQEVFRQMDGVMAYTAQAIDAVFSTSVRAQERQENIGDLVIPDPLPITSARFPLAGVGVGTLIINAPLSITNTLTATGESFLATTTVAGLLSADELALDALTVSGLVNAGALASNQLTIRGTAQLNTLNVSAAATVADLSVSGNTALTGLTVSELALVASLLVEGATQLSGLLEANGGIDTNGADVDLGAGSIYAANIVNEVIAGDGVTITGTTSAPIISVDLDSVVTEINGESGEVTITGGADIRVSSLRISNESTLSSVRGRGGCSGCLLDADVANTLTLTGGTIDGVIIGSTTIASAFFSDVTVGTSTGTSTIFSVLGSGTANFGGSLNIDSGCFSIGGACVVSAASSTSYVGLFDTPSTLIAGALQYASSTGSTLTQSANFVFDGASLAIGTTTPVSTLTVEGDTTLTGALAVSGTTTISGNIGATGNTTLTGSLVVSASSTFSDRLTVGGFVTLQSDLSVTGTSTIGGGLVVSGATTLSDALTIDGNVSIENGSSVRLYDADSSNYVAFTASTSLVGNTTWVLPGSDGNPNEVMVTDGAGNIRFEPVSAIGGGVTEYTNLIDTPASFTAGAIHYVNASGTALTESANFSYNGSSLAIGTSTPSATLTVDGSVEIIASNGSVGFMFDDASSLVGIGTDSPTDKLTLLNGSFSQIGGSAASQYSPAAVDILSVGDSARAMEVFGAYMYVVSSNAGDEFHVIDITDIANPVEVGGLNLPSFGNGIDVHGKYAYVASGFTGDDFHVIDVSDPVNPIEIDSLPLLGAANDVAVKDGYAYVVTDGTVGNVQVIDITNPYSVVSVASTTLVTNAKSIDIKGNYAYVTTEVSGDDFHVINISDPLNLVQEDSLNLPDGATAVKVSESGKYAYVGTGISGNDLHVIDVSNPSAISEINSIELNVSVEAISLVGEILYVTSLSAGQDLQVVDISAPSSPVLIGGVDLGSGNVRDVAVVGKYAYTASTAGINVVDISGAQLQSVLTSSFQTGNMFVTGQADLANDLAVRGMLYSGSDIQSLGVLKVYGTESSYVAGGFSIGTTSSSTGLTVDGGMKSTDLLGGATNVTTDANGNIIRDPSDIRLKTNVTQVEDALDILVGLRGVRYEWRDKERFGAQMEIGFIAQEVDLILPEVVRKGGDYWSINTRNILAVVVEAVKEVWAELQGTQKDVEDLRTRLGQLEEQLGEAKEGAVSSEEENTDSESDNVSEVQTEQTSNNTTTEESEDEVPQPSEEEKVVIPLVDEAPVATSSDPVVENGAASSASSTQSVTEQEADTVENLIDAEGEAVVMEEDVVTADETIIPEETVLESEDVAETQVSDPETVVPVAEAG